MAEAYMNHVGRDRWRAWSAGSNPAGAPNPFALETLKRHHIPIQSGADAPSSKSWNEFTSDNAPLMDAIITVCDNAAGEACPVWPARAGQAPQKLHWSFPDPAVATGSEIDKCAAFEMVFAAIKARVDLFIAEDSANQNRIRE